MELLLQGTAAAEGWPAPFCDCLHCEEARRRGGPNIRSRSGALIDKDFKIDFSADTLLQMQQCGHSLSHLQTLVFTHQHSDHIAANELHWACPPYTGTPPQAPIAVYGNAQVLALMQEKLNAVPKLQQVFDLHLLLPLQAVVTPTGDEILPLPADHVEGAFVLRITRGDKTIFYGHDSGLYPEETLDALGKRTPLDVALLDCTSGGIKTGNRGHMGVDGVLQMVDELRRRGAVTDATQIIATHFSHNGGLLHEELIQTFLPHRIKVAYDGMRVQI